jgi:hypothetical protein
MSDSQMRDVGSQPGSGTTGQPQQPSQQGDGSRSTGSASGAQPTKPTPLVQNTNPGTGSQGFRTGKKLPPKPQPEVRFGGAREQRRQPQPDQTGDDVTTTTPMMARYHPQTQDLAEDDAKSDTGVETKDKANWLDKGQARTDKASSLLSRQRQGDPPSTTTTTPMMARYHPQTQDLAEDDAKSDTGVETKDKAKWLDKGQARADKGPSLLGRRRQGDSPSISTTTKTPITPTTPAPTTTATVPRNQPQTHDLAEDDADTGVDDEDTQTQTSSISTTTQPNKRSVVGLKRAEGKQALAPDKAAWALNVATVLHLPVPSSQRRMLTEGLATADQIAASVTHSDQDKQAAAQHGRVLHGAGNPPWDAATAMKVAESKVQLDLLSIPPNDRKLSQLSQNSKNKTFWIENADPGGTKSKAFLCKPAGDGQTEAGGKPGSEVAREALAGRAAQFLLGKGLDIGMPETHVVKLSANLLPGNAGTGDITCSVQQYGDSKGALGSQSRDVKAGIDGVKVARLCVFDMMTLANDRHGGNILFGKNGELIPIDHGENFTETTNGRASDRLRTTLGGCSNALLSIPSAHDPMPEEVAKAVKSINPGELRATLKTDRDAIAARHGDMKGKISDEAIESAERAATFTRLAANMKPPIGPISIAAAQVALGTHVEELINVDYPVFMQNADRILKAVAKQQGAIKEVCLSSNTDYELLCQEVEKLGWRPQRRGEQTGSGLVADPIAMMAILAKGLKPPPKLDNIDYPPDLMPPEGTTVNALPGDVKDLRRDFREKAERDHRMQAVEQVRDTIGEQDAAEVLLKVRKQAVDALVQLTPANQRVALERYVQTSTRRLAYEPPEAAVAAYREMTGKLTDFVLADQRRRFSAVEQQYRLDLLSQYGEFNTVLPNSSYKDAFQELTAGNVLKCEVELVKLENSELLTDAKLRDAIYQRYTFYAGKEYDVPGNDPDVLALGQKLKSGDLAIVVGHYKGLKDRIDSGAFPKRI